MSCFSSPDKKSGFTLIELLTSIFIFSVVVTSVYGAYRATFHTVNGVEKQVNLTSEARVILERLTADFESLYVGEGGYLAGEKGEVAGNRGDNLSFTSSAHLLFNRSEQKAGRTILRYTAEEDESGRINLYRSDVPMRPGETEVEDDDEDNGLLLAQGLLAFQVTYVTVDEDERDSWDSEPQESLQDAEEQATAINLPALVRINVLFGEVDSVEEGVTFRTSVAIPQAPSENKADE